MLKSLFEPKEKKALSRRKAAARILLIILLIVIGYTVITLNAKAKKEAEYVLGSTQQVLTSPTPVSIDQGESLNTFLQDTVSEISSGASELGTRALQSAIETAKEEATKIVISQTASTVMTQIEKLPGKERKEIKDALCK